MQLFNATSSLYSILAFDIFQLLGLQNLNQIEKDKMAKQVEQLALTYFVQEKLQDNLTKEQLKELMESTGEPTTESIDEFMTKVGELLPNAEELMVEAIAEVKSRMVFEQINEKMKALNDRLDEAKANGEDTIVIEEMIAKCESNLALAQEEQWGMMNLNN